MLETTAFVVDVVVNAIDPAVHRCLLRHHGLFVHPVFSTEMPPLIPVVPLPLLLPFVCAIPCRAARCFLLGKDCTGDAAAGQRCSIGAISRASQPEAGGGSGVYAGGRSGGRGVSCVAVVVGVLTVVGSGVDGFCCFFCGGGGDGGVLPTCVCLLVKKIRTLFFSRDR